MSRLVHVRILKEMVAYVAQCLEYDITAQGNAPVEALDRWRRTAMGQVAIDKHYEREPFSDTPCAPIFYWCGIEKENLIGVNLDELLKAKPVETK